jgi:hypothetical protein
MTTVPRTQQRLQHAAGLPTILDAAYDAFEDTLLAIRAHEDPASGLFTAFIMAAASAADSRDAVGFAPLRLGARQPLAVQVMAELGELVHGGSSPFADGGGLVVVLHCHRAGQVVTIRSRAQDRHRIRLGGEAVLAPVPGEGWCRTGGGDRGLWSMGR